MKVKMHAGGKWWLLVPPRLSGTGKRQDLYFAAKQEGLTAKAKQAVAEEARLLANAPTDVLTDDARRYEKAVKHYITAPLAQEEYDALVSLAFNIGPGNFAKSSVVAEVNKNRHKVGDENDRRAAIEAIRAAFGHHNKSKGVVLPGLTRRRKEEADAFLAPALRDLKKRSSTLRCVGDSGAALTIP